MTQFDQHVGQLRLASLDVHPSGGARYYTGAWVSGTTPQTIVHDLGWDQFVAQWQQLSDQGWRLTRVQAYPSAGPDLFAGVFDQGGGGYALLMGTDWDKFNDFYQANKAAMRLVDFQVYDSGPTRWYIGVWRETAARHEFVTGLDWGSFVGAWDQLSGQGLRLKRVIAYPNPVPLPNPDWRAAFDKALGSAAMGYAYAVARNGVVTDRGAVHSARAGQDPPSTPWTDTVRINLASVSKSVTAVAVLKLLGDKGLSVDDFFYPILAPLFPNVGQGVGTVTIRNLLTMKSGMVVDDKIYMPDVRAFLVTYLGQGLVGTPGQTYAYSNTNFTVLQVLTEYLSGTDYVDYVTQNVLVPMGVDPAVFNATPDPPGTATLSYIGASDTSPGVYWPAIPAVAAGGWIANAKELFNFLCGVRANRVLSADATLAMLNGQLGWYTYDGLYGQYFHHNGGLQSSTTPPIKGLVTGIIHLSDGYDALLLVNSWGFDVVGLIVQAFEGA